MKKKEVFTGERVILNKTTPKGIIQNHLERYNFAKNFVKGKTVLDLACGTGYGSEILLLAGAKKVFGGDISEAAIKYAKKNYSRPGLNFLIMNAENIPLEDNSIEVVVSFETIEHLPNYEKFLSEVKRVLKKGGTFICSSPNKLVNSPFTKKPLNKYHFKEFKLKELKKIFEDCGIKIKSIYGQSFFYTSLFFYVKKFMASYFPLLSKIKKAFVEKTRVDNKDSRIYKLDKFKKEKPTFFIIISKNGK